MRSFTTEGPCDPQRHYHLPAAPRLAEALGLVDEGAYFLLCAPRRTGKTTTLRALAAELLESRRFAALVCPAELGEPAGDDLARIEHMLLASLRLSAEHDLPPELRPPPFPDAAEGTRIWAALAAWARVCHLPIVLFFDGMDALSGAALRTVLRQLEVGHARRPAQFPWSVVLAGQGLTPKDDEPLTSGRSGPFDVATPSATLASFTADEIRALYAELTADTGQTFDEEAIKAAWEATAGHPFLVQALGREVASRTAGPVGAAEIQAAARRLVASRITPIDGLGARLSEPRLRRVIEPLLTGTSLVAGATEADIASARALGLLAMDNPVRIEAGLHRDLVPRLLAEPAARAFTDAPERFFGAEGRLDVEALLHAFAVFYETHGRDVVPAMPYPAAASELVFLGFLYRMIEGRGAVDVRYGSSLGRVEATLTIPNEGGEAQREVFVLVSRRKGSAGVKARALGWLEERLEAEGLANGTAVVFDRRSKRRVGERVKLSEATTAKGHLARVLRA